ncbi:DUF397 domain-containing protein [Nonomuraea cavernae]|uniref:DUF397 domain-containing protein n=1 Tax=Nonomuraea cavernae TaxID=2045107 RepID=A0A917ZKC1_9ACTN|nr:DUF397 domain-containing protein [Nonomuraea cavernae]MCA2188349.1 DUF397 domain-containing protein [Nonomuraea cavernae]GGO83559.1 hypothetical protein GCM10012289_77270 [Nonomuraea cavernae]
MSSHTPAIWHSCNNGSCVEVAALDGQVWVRSSEDTSRTALTFTFEEWQTFTEGVKQGLFDLERLAPHG